MSSVAQRNTPALLNLRPRNGDMHLVLKVALITRAAHALQTQLRHTDSPIHQDATPTEDDLRDRGVCLPPSVDWRQMRMMALMLLNHCWKGPPSLDTAVDYHYPMRCGHRIPSGQYRIYYRYIEDENYGYVVYIHERNPDLDKHDLRRYCAYCDILNRPQFMCRAGLRHCHECADHHCCLCLKGPGEHNSLVRRQREADKQKRRETPDTETSAASQQDAPPLKQTAPPTAAQPTGQLDAQQTTGTLWQPPMSFPTSSIPRSLRTPMQANPMMRQSTLTPILEEHSETRDDNLWKLPAQDPTFLYRSG